MILDTNILSPNGNYSTDAQHNSNSCAATARINTLSKSNRALGLKGDGREIV